MRIELKESLILNKIEETYSKQFLSDRTHFDNKLKFYRFELLHGREVFIKLNLFFKTFI